MMTRCAALVPCRNEAVALPGLLEGVRGYLSDVLVVDDGSIDGTAGVARRHGAQCIRLSPGQGKGAALQAGFRHLERLGFRHALTMDGDGQHCPHDIPGFFSCFEDTGADLVVGSRKMTFGMMPWPRLVVNRVMSACLSVCARRKLPDSQCGFRLVDLKLAREVETVTQHFEFESEMLVKFIRRGCRVEFVPVQTIYRGERSKIRPMADTVRWLRCYVGLLGETA